MSAGALRERIAFDMRSEANDGYGNRQGGWVEQFTVAARRKPLMGGEAVMQGRLESRQPFVLTVRVFAATKRITTAWRARVARGGEVYNIRSIINVDEQNRYFDILVERGGAEG